MSVSPQYIAGFFDGEGYVGIHQWKGCESYILKVQLTNTHRETLERIQSQYGGRIHAHDRQVTNPKWRNIYVLVWHTHEARNILELIHPYLITKKQRVSYALDFPLNKHREYRSPEKIAEQRRVYEKLKSLNNIVIEIPLQYKNIAIQEHSEYLRKKQQAVDLRKQHPDWSIRQIATEMKLSSTMVHKYLKDSGVSTKKEGFGEGVLGKLVYKYRKPVTDNKFK